MESDEATAFAIGRRWRIAASLCAALLSACGGGGDGGSGTVGDVSAPPTITAAPANQSVKLGDVANFSVSARGDAPLSYQWQRDGVDVLSATQDAYSTASTRLLDNGSKWSVRVTNAKGAVTSEAATLTVAPVEPGTISLVASTYPLQHQVDAQGRFLRIESDGIKLVAQDGTTTTVLARATWEAAGIASTPGDATMDANGNLYFVETVNYGLRPRETLASSVIWQYGRDGTLTPFAGKYQQIGFQEGIGTSARFEVVYGLRFRPNGDLYGVSGTGLVYAVFKISPSAAVSWVASGSRFDWDAAGNTYTLDFGQTYPFTSPYALVRKVTSAGVQTVLAGSSVLTGYRDGPGEQALLSNAVGGFAVDPQGNVYIAQAYPELPSNQPVTSLIRRISPTGNVTTVAGQIGLIGTVAGPLPGSICWLASLAFDAEGLLYGGCRVTGGIGDVFSVRFGN